MFSINNLAFDDQIREEAKNVLAKVKDDAKDGETTNHFCRRKCPIVKGHTAGYSLYRQHE